LGSLAQNTQVARQKPQEKQQTLTPAQTAQVKKILSQFNASKLTAADAKAIHEKFREAGIHAGPETNDAIKAAGFDPEKLRTLAPPPNKEQAGKPIQQTIEGKMKVVNEKIIVPLALTTAQKDVVNKAFKEYYTEIEKLTKPLEGTQKSPDKSKVEPIQKVRDEKIKKALPAEKFNKYLELEKVLRPQKPKE
jgi:hypothetical protein